MTEPTDAEIKDLYAQETGFILDDSPAALLDFARAVLAKWGQPSGAGEPVAWYEYNADLDAWFLAYSHNHKAKTRPLVFGDATPQPNQAQAGAVPLTPEQVAEIADAAHREYDRLVGSGQCAPRWSAVFAHLLERAHGIGIKGGQP